MYQKLKKLLSLTLMLPSLLASTSVVATQLIEGSDRNHVQVNVSANEQNRLAIEGKRIGSVVPSQKGAIVYVKDEAAGALYFSFPNESNNGATVTLFVTDEINPAITYKLILVPRPIAGDEIIIKPVLNKAAVSANASDGRAFSYQRRVKDLILTMAEESNSDAETIAVNKVIPLWKESRLALLSNTLAGDMVGEKYRLTNISSDNMILAEQELFRRGVIAVSIENHTLPVNGQTLIFIVRGRNANE